MVLFEPLFLYAVTGEYFTFDFEKKMKQSCSETCENVPRVRYYFFGRGELNRSSSYTEEENKGVNGLIFVF